MVAKGFGSRTNLPLLYESQKQSNQCMTKWAFYPGEQDGLSSVVTKWTKGLAGDFFPREQMEPSRQEAGKWIS